MHVSIVDTGHNECAFQIDKPGCRIFLLQDFAVASDGKNLMIADCDCSYAMRNVARQRCSGKDRSVVVDRFRRRPRRFGKAAKAQSEKHAKGSKASLLAKSRTSNAHG